MKKLQLGMSVLVLVNCLGVARAEVEISANLGAVTQYVFRGVPQSDGKAAAQGGLDLNVSGFYLGTWISEVDTTARTPDGVTPATGLEYDLYGGYSFAVDGFNFGLGAIQYAYTDGFDERYVEVDFSAGWRFFQLDYVAGKYNNGPTQDYTFFSAAVDYAGFYGKVGRWGDQFNGNYVEIGYGSTLSVGETDLFDYSFALIRSDDNLSTKVDSDGNPDEDTFFYAGVTKSFTFFSN